MPGLYLADVHQRVPRRHSRAGQGRGGLERQSRRNRDRVLFAEQRVLGQYAVRRRGTERDARSGLWLPANPVAKKRARDTIADAKARDTGAGRDHLAGAVRQRHGILLQRAAEILATRDCQIAKIQRGGAQAHPNLAGGRLWLGSVDPAQAVYPSAAGNNLVRAHRLAPLGGSGLKPEWPWGHSTVWEHGLDSQGTARRCHARTPHAMLSVSSTIAVMYEHPTQRTAP